ncbi:inositol monophosphatase family protein [Streptomyces sp. SID9727]|uniref:inositol monophosphatase family protein n=1 Tax=Streptomyces sp. SID9727 TaxID=2706114 RepID=UPI0013C69142|nr:inositol monophosphatase family protein [Streptomyces sp. SID9727]NEC69107.1 inositol monophosphatase [Streptomyces sp. SID9727]
MNELDELSVRLREVATEAALTVAPDLVAAFRSTMDVAFKRDEHDPVTVHDQRAEERIRDLLAKRVPDSTVVGEEGGRQDGSGRIAWYVDPIDGTANFARGLAFFCTSVGVTVDGEPVAGAIVDPVAGHVFTADATGARLGGEPLRPGGVREEGRGLLITGFPTTRELAWNDPQTLPRFGELVARYGTVRRTGSAALTLAHVAAGWCDAALGTSVNAWDICAARVLVRRSGGVYHSFAGDDGWDQPGYLAHGANLEPLAAREFVEWYLSRLPARSTS